MRARILPGQAVAVRMLCEQGCYMELNFEWHTEKAATNLRKHGVSFDEAKTIFNDPLSITIFDDRHSDAEPRFIDIGRSAQGRLLVVVYTEHEAIIRLISSREATRTERNAYEQQF
jgi:uncharacterized protein